MMASAESDVLLGAGILAVEPTRDDVATFDADAVGGSGCSCGGGGVGDGGGACCSRQGVLLLVVHSPSDVCVKEGLVGCVGG